MRIFVPCSIINTTRANVITGQYQFLQRGKDDDELQQLPSFPVLSSSSDSDLNLSPAETSINFSMSEPTSPSRDESSSNREDTLSPSTSAMDSGTFYSINDSDIDTMTLSSLEMEKSHLEGGGAGEKTLTNLSQSTLSFILDEQQNVSANNVATKQTPSLPIMKSSDLNANASGEPAPLNVDRNPMIGKPIVSPTPDGLVKQEDVKPVIATINASDSIISVDSSNNNLSTDIESNLSSTSAASLIDLDETAISISDSSTEDDSSLELSPSKNASNNTKDEDSFDESTYNIKIYDTVSEFEEKMPNTVTILRHPSGGKVYLVGTAHFSVESQDDVSLVIRNTKPDIVMVELCASRIHILKYDEQTLLKEAGDISFSKVQGIIKQHGLINGIFYVVLLKASAKLTNELGMAPGGEFRRALEEVHRMNTSILHLGDRPINVTLQRALHRLSYWQTLKIVCRMIMSSEKISKEDVEKCKQNDLLEELMQQMAGQYPVFRDVFVNERDMYLCHSLQIAITPQIDASGEMLPVNVVGVVGIGHLAGIKKHWGKVDRAKIVEISTIPEMSRTSKVVKFAVRWGFWGAVGYGLFRLVRPRLPARLL